MSAGRHLGGHPRLRLAGLGAEWAPDRVKWVSAALVACVALTALVGIASDDAALVMLYATVAAWALATVLWEASNVATIGRPRLVPYLLGSLVVVHVAFPGLQLEALLQVLLVALLVVYLILTPAAEQRAALRRVAWPLLMASTVMLLVGVSYAGSGATTREWVFFFSLVASLASIPMVGLYCRTWADIERLATVFIALSLLQAPIVAGQASGLNDRLPGPLVALSGKNYGGPVAQLDSAKTRILHKKNQMLDETVRYPGSFADYELMAEYCGLMLLLALGMFAFGLARRWRWLQATAVPVLGACGWFTGTRAFVYGVIGGGVLLLVLSLFVSGRRLGRVGRIVVLSGALIAIVVLVVPDQVTLRFFDRLALPSILGGSQSLNRAQLYETGFGLLDRMPFLGYGADMIRVFKSAYIDPEVPSPHSIYLNLLLTAGWQGLAAIVAMMATVIVLPLLMILRPSDLRSKAWGAVLLTVMLYWAGNEAKIDFFRLLFYVDFCLALVALVGAAFTLTRDERRSGVGQPAHDRAESRDLERHAAIAYHSGAGARCTATGAQHVF